MLTEYAQQKLDLYQKHIKRQSNKCYQSIEAYEKIHMLQNELMITLYLFENNLLINYTLKRTENLEYIANYILEKIEEKLNFSYVTYEKYPDYDNFDFICEYKDIKIRITFDTRHSDNCIVEYEDVVTQKAIMKCI